jgi:hypothetical protein
MTTKEHLEHILNHLIDSTLSVDEALLVLETAQQTIEAAIGGLQLSDVVNSVEVETTDEAMLN